MKYALLVCSCIGMLFLINGNGLAEVDCTKVINTTCSECHSKDQICAQMGQPEGYWKAMIKFMISNGANISAEEQTALISCLTNSEAACKLACGK